MSIEFNLQSTQAGNISGSLTDNVYTYFPDVQAAYKTYMSDAALAMAKEVDKRLLSELVPDASNYMLNKLTINSKISSKTPLSVRDIMFYELKEALYQHGIDSAGMSKDTSETYSTSWVLKGTGQNNTSSPWTQSHIYGGTFTIGSSNTNNVQWAASLSQTALDVKGMIDNDTQC